MRKNYSVLICLSLLLLFNFKGFSQQIDEPRNNTTFQNNADNHLNIYPNPVTNGKVYISSKFTGTRDIKIFDVLGKKVLETSLFGNALDVSSLAPGVYIIKIKEKSEETTRKLVIR